MIGRRCVWILAACSLLAGSCGGSAAPARPRAAATSSPAAGATPQAGASVAASASPAGLSQPAAVAGAPAPSLNIATRALPVGFPGRVGCPRWPGIVGRLVLATGRLTANDVEVGQMGAAFAGQAVDPARVPATLRLVPGAPTSTADTGRGQLVTWLSEANACLIGLVVTNTGRTTVQIGRAGFRLTGAPSANTAAYALVEACSVLHVTQYCGPGKGGGPSACSGYSAGVQLQPAAAGTDFTAAPFASEDTGAPCPPPTLAPNASVDLWLAAYSTRADIYPAEPVLTVSTPAGPTTVAVESQAAPLAFAGADQFTCYRLTGNTFTPWRRGAPALDTEANANAGGWCV
jgi:hypothetical protein